MLLLLNNKGYKCFIEGDISVEGYFFLDAELYSGYIMIDYFKSVSSFEEFKTKISNNV